MIGKLDRLERIAAARRNFVVRAQEDKELLLLSLQRWLEGAEEEREAIRVLAHRLRGTAGSYGFMTVTKAAANLEFHAQQISTAGDLASASQRLITELEAMQADRPS